MRLLAIDPGPEKSAWLVLDGTTPTAWGIDLNEDVPLTPGDHLAIEMVQSFGMAVGAEVFETVFWIGRFVEAWQQTFRGYTRVYRKDVKLHMCGTPRAKDANIRQALIDRYGGKEAAIGTKKAPGPLYGIKADLWSALAVGITWMETRK